MTSDNSSHPVQHVANDGPLTTGCQWCDDGYAQFQYNGVPMHSLPEPAGDVQCTATPAPNDLPYVHPTYGMIRLFDPYLDAADKMTCAARKADGQLIMQSFTEAHIRSQLAALNPHIVAVCHWAMRTGDPDLVHWLERMCGSASERTKGQLPMSRKDPFRDVRRVIDVQEE